ncbi:MAG: cytochrome c biogenesis protein CcdA [Methylovulum sp.]|nr:cytochrome c biogenesis protein CcdA [Methylovulum sp.]
MKTISAIIMLWMLGISMASAAIPKADLGMSVLNAGQWPAQYRISLKIPQDHHAYLNTGANNSYIPVTFDAGTQLAGAGLAIERLQKPAGTYDDLVKAQVLREQGEFTLELAQAGKQPLTDQPFPLTVKYQLCNDLTHVCFRPQTAQVDLPLPPPALVGAANGDGETTQGFMDSLLMLFKSNQDNTALMFGLMFLAGLLSVATPCVYPMLPITSLFIVNRAQGVAHKEKQHALVYLAGIVGTYTLLGLIAGMTGGAFNAVMQSAYINLGFAAFFAFFALALLGFYELGFMQNEVYNLDHRSSQVKGLTGTWLMGSVAGLVISPCVGPIVFALLLQVADNIAEQAAALESVNQQLTFWGRLGIASTGSIMMAGFGAGVGIPFFIVSVVKFKKLPKAGYWMNKIKYAFGLMILYFAYAYFGKGMGVLGVTPATTLSLAIGMLAIWIAVVNCNVLTLLPADAAPNQKMHHYCGLMALIIGGWLVVASLGQLPFAGNAQANAIADTSQPSTADATPAIQEEAGITWHKSYQAAQKLAQQTGKPVFIDFYASWCANCVAFKEETIHNKALNDALRNNAIAVKLVDKEPEFEKFRQHPDHRQLKIGLPYFAILTPDGLLAWSGSDYKATQKMVSVLTHWAG